MDNPLVPARFYAPAAGSAGEVISLPDDEGEHLARVLRLSTGAEIRVFDGAGREFHAVVEDIGRVVRVRLTEAASAAPEPRVAITLAQAVLKGDKMDAVVRDTVMMGVAAIRPIVTARCEVSIGTLERSRRVERWRRIAVASAKQCGRAMVPVVDAPVSFEEGNKSPSWQQPSIRLMLLEPKASADAIPLRELPAHPPPEAIILVGPEGGWSAMEIEFATASSCQLVTLQGPTLRADAMPVIALAALFTHWNVY